MWSLDSPLALLFFGLIPFLIYLVHFRKKRGGILLFGFSIWRGEETLKAVKRGGLIYGFFWALFWVGFILLIIALSGPVVISKQEVYLNKGIDMIIVLDESPSMSAPDFKPVNRFESAKQVIRRFVSGRENDQIGLVTFSSEALLRVPPTLDYDVLLETLTSLSIMDLGEGTAIGMGLATAALHLKSSKARSKVIILLTDGVNNEGTVLPEDAVFVAADLGIKIYSIGIGRHSESTWKFVDEKTGREYQASSGEFDEKLLIKIATASGGKYFNAGNPNALDGIFDEINSMEKTGKRLKIFVEKKPQYGFFVFLGLSLVLLSFLARKLVLQEIF
ncbi:MAG: VWA domain-containing protein [Spirochaetales bacterium]|nr:VWA domain-containing protein [Spirochaetales bacterium]